MPKKFTECTKSQGSRVRTLKDGRKICFPKKGKAQVGHQPTKRGG